MNNKEEHTPRKRGPMGHGPGGGNPGEKAKDFKSAIIRLFSELKGFRAFVTIALLLAVLGSILSIFAPNKLSDMTDEISKGLVVNQKNLKLLTKEMTKNFNEDTISKTFPEILNIDLSQDIIMEIMSDNDT